MRMQNGIVTLEDSPTVSYRAKYSLTTISCNQELLGIYSTGLKFMSTQKPAYECL